MKKEFRVQLRAYGHYADFKIFSKDTKEDIENSIVDKLGQNEVKLEKDGFTGGKWITYEEVRNDRRPVHYETVLGTRVEAGAPERG